MCSVLSRQAINMAQQEQEQQRWHPSVSVLADSWGSGPSRDLTAVAVAGPVGAASTVYETNWKCGDCNAENYPRRLRW